MRVLGIDPGPEKSGLVSLWLPGPDHVVEWHCENEHVLSAIVAAAGDAVVIERPVSFRGHVTQAAVDTAIWVGRFVQRAADRGCKVVLVPRGAVTIALLGKVPRRADRVIIKGGRQCVESIDVLLWRRVQELWREWNPDKPLEIESVHARDALAVVLAAGMRGELTEQDGA